MHIFYVKPGSNERAHTNVELDLSCETLGSLKAKIADVSGLKDFRLLHLGRTMEGPSKPLSAFNLLSNSTVHVLRQQPKEPEEVADVPRKPMSDDEVQQFLIALGMAIRNPSFHKVAMRLGQRENLENIAVTCPDLAKDPVACAFLSKPELLYSLLDPETLKYVSGKHPGLCEAAYQLAAAVHEEKPATPSSSTASTSASASSSRANNQQEEASLPAPPFAYNLDEMSDDDVDEDDEDDEFEDAGAGGSRRLRPPITADQLATALAAAQSSLGGSSGMSLGGMTGLASRPSGQASASSSGITQDQLAAALAMAVGGDQPAQQTTTMTSMPSSMDQSPVEPNYEAQLATMREMGITDAGLASRALQVMGGDLQAAIDLIYSGWLGDDDSAN